MMAVDLYDILGVESDADQEAIKQAFRRRAQEYHPDRNPGDPEAEERFKEVLAAFEILSDPRQRRRYDSQGLDGVEDPSKAGVRQSDQPAGEEVWPDDRNLGEVFSDVFEGRSPFDTSHFENVSGFDRATDAGVDGQQESASSRLRRSGDDVVESIEVDFMTAVNGGEVAVDLADETVRVMLREGTATGDRLRVEGRGEPAPNEWGEPGDLLLEVSVADHPHLRREGLDLYLELPVTVGEAILGKSIRVPTPRGEVTVEVPEGVDCGTRLRLEGRGVRREEEAGDLFATLQIRTPDTVDAEVEEAVETIEVGYSKDVRSDISL
jgi:DnaJ-class molecular chaperone